MLPGIPRPRARYPWTVTLAVAGLLALPAASSHAAGALEVTNLGLTFDEPYLAVDGRRAVVGVIERFRGPADLNGDGDTDDVVLHVHDAATGVTTNLGHAIATNTAGLSTPMLALRGELVAFAKSEPSSGADLNQDGDRLDDVAHLVNVRTRAVTNLRLAAGRMHFAASYAVFTVDEAGQGIDDNGDGDRLDHVLAFYDPAKKRLTRLRLATTVDEPARALGGAGRLLFAVDEAAHGGLDRNGDGDAQDSVVAYHRLGVGTTNVRLAATPAHDFQHARSELSGPLVAINARELDNGADLNGDGDTADYVGYGVDWVNGTVHRGHAGTALRTRSTTMIQVASEIMDGRDLNNDADAWDDVLIFTDVATGQVWNTGYDLPWWRANHGVSSGEQQRVVVELDEAGSNGTDFNQDGDLDDFVLARIDPVSRQTDILRADSACAFASRSVVLADSHQPPVSGPRAMACVREWVDGVDRNKDGDLDDATARVWDLDSGQAVADLGQLYSPNAFPRWVGDQLYFEVLETDAGADHTGDGTQGQRVVARLDTATGQTAVAPWAVRPTAYGPTWGAGSHEVFVGMWEPSDGRDLNGNGTANDLFPVLFVVR